MKKIAIIIPVYNVEKYIGECLQSVVNQSIGIDNLQVILINDGSTDKSLEIAENYKQLFPNSILIESQINQGLSAARNAGMELIDAEYTMFMDSDDLLPYRSCEQLYACAKTQHCDMVIGKMEYFPAMGSARTLDYSTYKQGWFELTNPDTSIPISAGGRIFSSNTVANLRFKSKLKIQEDINFILRYIFLYKGIFFLDQTVYKYRLRQERDSLIDLIYTNSDNYFNFLNEGVRSIFELLENNHENQTLKQIVINHLLFPLAQYVQHMEQGLSDEDKHHFIRQVQECLGLISTEHLREFYDAEIKIMLLSVRERGFKAFQSTIKTQLNDSNQIILDLGTDSYNLRQTLHVAGLDRISIDKEKVEIRGYFYLKGITSFTLDGCCLINDKRFTGKEILIKSLIIKNYGMTFDYSKAGFMVEIPIQQINSGFHPISFEFQFKSATQEQTFRLLEYSIIDKSVFDTQPVYANNAEIYLRSTPCSLSLQIKPIRNVFIAKKIRFLKNRLTRFQSQ